MNSKDYRKLNTILLAKEVGSISALAALINSSQSYLSQIIGPSAKRAMGDDMARRLEVVFNKEHGWMDVPHIDSENKIKATQIYEYLLRFDSHQLDALITVLGMSQLNSISLGQVNIEGAEKISPSKRKTDLGTEKIGEHNAVTRSRTKKAG